MFAPPITKPKAKTALNGKSTLHRAMPFGQRHGGAEQDAGPVRMSARSGPARPSWDISKIPVVSSDRPESFQPPSPVPAPRLPIQAKLKVGTVDDPLEHEADRVADQVMRMPAPGVSTAAARPQASYKCAACGEEEEKLQKKPAGPQAATSAALAIVHEVLRSPGQPLDDATRAYFEPRFGQDFSRVRVHADAQAAATARALDAKAYTVGCNIVFGDDQSAANRSLLAHELAHVRQDALGGSPGVWLRRAPCPSCHKPVGTQHVALEDLHDDDVHYLPDEDASEFFTYMRAGLVWGEYHGGARTRVRSVRYYNYDGSSQIVGYVLNFNQAHFSFGDRSVGVTIDVHGNQLGMTGTSDAIESVISPIDFIGPGLLSRPLVGGARALAGGLAKASPRVGAAVAGTARSLAFSARLTTSEYLGAAMRGGADFSTLAAEGGARSAFVLREGGQFTAAPTQAGRMATEVADTATAVNAPPVRVTGPSFADVSNELGLEAPGTIRYRSAAAAAAGARAAGLETASRPGFQSHATASSVRRAFSISGSVWQSAHIVPQAVYRALRARGLRVSEGRAFTTLLPREAHAAFDRSWIRDWNDAVTAGRTIRAEDVYKWVSRAINAVDDQVIDAGVKGAINDRLRTEMFVDLGLNLDDPIVAGHP